MHKMLNSAVIPLVALGALGLTSTPVAAESGTVAAKGTNEKVHVYHVDGHNHATHAGYVEFKHKGDHFYTYRKESPGNRIYIQYHRVGVDDEYKTISGGLHPGDETHHNKNLPEGKAYWIWGCVQVNHGPDYCADAKKFTA